MKSAVSGIANAQPAPTATGALRGAVTTAAPDGQSYNVPRASLKLQTPTQTLDAVTGEAGEYQFTNLLPGAYTLKATVQGFETASKIVTIRAGQTSVENISLEVDDGAATVAAPSSTSGQGVQTTETAPAASAQQETNNETFKDPTARVFELLLPSEHLFGDWGGLRSKLEESGITPRLILVTDLAGNPSGGRSQGVTAPSGVFGSVTVAPDSRIQQLPLFITAGVSARGLFDARARDAVSLGVASGHFSEDLKRAQRNGRMLGPSGGVPDHETIIELTYRFDLRKGAFFIQPDFQFLEKKIRVGLQWALDVFFEHDIAQYVTPRDVETLNRLLETARQSHGGPTPEQLTAEPRSEAAHR